MKSVGSVAFASLVDGQHAEWGAKLNAARSTVGAWAAGTRVPKQPQRVMIRDAGGPPPQAWDEHELGLTAKRQRPDARPDARATPDAVQSAADRLMGQAETLQRELETDDELELEARVRVAERLGSLIAQLGKHTGHTITSHRQILASPLFVEVRDAMGEALKPWPEALRAVAAALRDLESK